MRIYPDTHEFDQTPTRELWTTATALLDALRSGRTTSRELTEESLAEIERTPPAVPPPRLTGDATAGPPHAEPLLVGVAVQLEREHR